MNASDGSDPVEDAQPAAYILTPAEYEATRIKVDKWNRAAEKKGLAGRIVLSAVPHTFTEDTPTGPITRAGWKVTVDGTRPKFNDWEFIARAEWLPSGGGLVVTSPVGLPDGTVDRDRLRKGWCDHCRTNRNRAKVYLVRRTDDDVTMQVGSSCVADFTGYGGVIAWGAGARLTDMLDDFVGGAHGREWGHSTEDALAIAYHLTVTDGFWPMAADRPTRYAVDAVLDPRSKMPDAERSEIWAGARARIESGDVAAVCDWIATTDKDDGDYLANLRAILACEQVSYRHMGLLVSAPNAYLRHLAAGKPAVEVPETHWFGEVDGKYSGVPVTVGTYLWYDTMYGPKAWVTFTTTDGAILKWNTTSDAFAERAGDEIALSFTVTAHSEWNERKETHVLRARVTK